MDKYDEAYVVDIGEIIKQRALKSYGVQDFLLNINLLSDDKSEMDVKYLWTWFDSKNIFLLIYKFLYSI